MNQKPKKYSFSRPEFLYVSEHRAIIQTYQALAKQLYELHDALIRRYVASTVLERIKLDPKGKFIQVNDDGSGIDVYDNPEPVATPTTDKKAETQASAVKPK